jgi:HSP20 family molecular chaperone IbpA
LASGTAPTDQLRYALADKAFEVTAELPGLDVKNIDLQLSDLVLTIKGEKQED